MERSSGVLMHISSLYGKYSCGSLGKSAFEFIDFLHDSGFRYWQILPFGITDSFGSPYMSYSSFGGNPYFIDLDTLGEAGLLTPGELAGAEQSTPYVCEFERLGKERYALLKKAASRCVDRNAVEEFIGSEPRIAECCEFMARCAANGGKSWNEWTEDGFDEEDLFAWKFIQYEFHREFTALKLYAEKNGVGIIGDLPFYVSYNSADVYFGKEGFLLDRENRPICSAGVPPDYFSEDGQLWGNPIYDWKKMKEDGYRHWKERVKQVFKYCDVIRIDHFRAISEYWTVPAGAVTAADGKWNTGPGMALTAALDEAAQGKMIIAENLGITDSSVEKLLNDCGYPGMAVLQFGFDGKSTNEHLPHNFRERLVAYTGTHDNNTFLGYIWECSEKERRELFDYLGFRGARWEDCCETAMRILMMSKAELTVFPVQDLLGYGADTRLNTPGRAEGNWAYRMVKDQFDSLDREKYLRMNKTYSRFK